MRQQVTDWEKIFVKGISDRYLLSKIHKELLKLNIKITNSPIKRWAKDFNRYLTKEGVQMANKQMKRFSISYVIRELQIKTTVRYHHVPIRVTEIQKTTNCSQGCGATGIFILCR